MNTYSEVVVIQSNGNLGGTNPADDGITLIIGSGAAVSGKFALGDVQGPFLSPEDANANGLDDAYDTTNSTLIYQHIKDFYATPNNTLGTELYVMVVAPTVTMTQMSDVANNYIKKAIEQLNGKIKLVVVTRNPAHPYSPTLTDGIDNDILAAIPKLKELIAEQRGYGRPFSAIMEVHNLGSTIASLKDMRATDGPLANRIAFMIGQDADVAATAAYKAKYASAGYLGGKFAGIPVQRSSGRVKDGAVKLDKAAISNGTLWDSISEVNRKALGSKGYIFFRNHIGLPDFYLSRPLTGAPATDDYSLFTNGRVIDKATRIVQEVYAQELEDDVLLDEFGKMSAATIKSFQNTIETAINLRMTSRGEISGCEAFCDPEQVVASTDEIKVKLDIFRVGNASKIEVTIGFKLNLA